MTTHPKHYGISSVQAFIRYIAQDKQGNWSRGPLEKLIEVNKTRLDAVGKMETKEARRVLAGLK